MGDSIAQLGHPVDCSCFNCITPDTPRKRNQSHKNAQSKKKRIDFDSDSTSNKPEQVKSNNEIQSPKSMNTNAKEKKNSSGRKKSKWKKKKKKSQKQGEAKTEALVDKSQRIIKKVLGRKRSKSKLPQTRLDRMAQKICKKFRRRKPPKPAEIPQKKMDLKNLKTLDELYTKLNSIEYDPVSIWHAINNFTVHFRLKHPFSLLNFNHSRVKMKRQVNKAKFRFLKSNFRRILKIKRIDNKWTCCKNRFEAIDFIWLIKDSGLQKIKRNVLQEISSMDYTRITTANGGCLDPSVDIFLIAENFKNFIKPRIDRRSDLQNCGYVGPTCDSKQLPEVSPKELINELVNEAVDSFSSDEHSHVSKVLDQSDDSSVIIESEISAEEEENAPQITIEDELEQEIEKSNNFSCNEELSEPTLTEQAQDPNVESVNQSKEENIQREPNHPNPIAVQSNNQLQSISDSALVLPNIVELSRNIETQLPNVAPGDRTVIIILNSDGTTKATNPAIIIPSSSSVNPPVAVINPCVSTSNNDCSEPALKESSLSKVSSHKSLPREESPNYDSSSSIESIIIPVKNSQRKRKRESLVRDDSIPQTKQLRSCSVVVERLSSPKKSVSRNPYKLKPKKPSREGDPRTLIFGAESARKRTGSESESDAEFRPVVDNGDSSSESTLSNVTESPSSPASEESDMIVSDEYGASEYEYEERRRKKFQDRKRKQPKPFIVLKTAEERQRLREKRKQKKKMRAEKNKCREEYVECHMGHLPFVSKDIDYAIDVITNKLGWNVFPFGAKFLGHVSKKELDLLNKSEESKERKFRKKDFLLRYFREAYGLKKVDKKWICCKNRVDYLDAKAFLKLFWNISVH